MNTLRVLLVYPNGRLMNPPAISIGIFTALLKENGFEVDLFDTTLYADPKEVSSDDAKQKNLQVRPFNYAERGIKLKETDIQDDLKKKIAEFLPELIAVSVLENSYPTAVQMFRVIESLNIPVIVGGVFATFAPEIVLANKCVSAVCIGEGEETLVEVCKKIAAGEDYLDTENLCFQKEGKMVKNKLKKLTDINALPMPDYSLFEKERFFRPMAGKVYRTVPIETNRGCPYGCTFCNSPYIAQLYKDSGSTGYFRKKNMERIQKELRYLVKKWDAEYIYFTSDTFLAINDEEFDKFIDIYSEFKIPFWLQSRVETLTEYRAEKLKKVGCHRISIGLEHGNSEFRKVVLKKKFGNDQMLKASKILADAGIPLTVNNIIGFPGETRDLIFDTIELNRQLIFDTANCAVFTPFHGTYLHQLCVEKGYISNDYTSGSMNVDAAVKMPTISIEEIKGLRRTFSLYARMPKEMWPMIMKAEKYDEEGNKTFFELSKIYQEKYFT